jgi:hypothetical protein
MGGHARVSSSVDWGVSAEARNATKRVPLFIARPRSALETMPLIQEPGAAELHAIDVGVWLL